MIGRGEVDDCCDPRRRPGVPGEAAPNLPRRVPRDDRTSLGPPAPTVGGPMGRDLRAMPRGWVVPQAVGPRAGMPSSDGGGSATHRQATESRTSTLLRVALE